MFIDLLNYFARYVWMVTKFSAKWKYCRKMFNNVYGKCLMFNFSILGRVVQLFKTWPKSERSYFKCYWIPHWALGNKFFIWSYNIFCSIMTVWNIEISPLICSVNQWTGFYMIGTSIMKQLNNVPLYKKSKKKKEKRNAIVTTTELNADCYKKFREFCKTIIHLHLLNDWSVKFSTNVSRNYKSYEEHHGCIQDLFKHLRRSILRK